MPDTPPKWVSARPTMLRTFSTAERLFTTDNANGVCAGYSQTWLVVSILQGKPVTQPNSIVQNTGMVTRFHRGQGRGGRSHPQLGGRSVTTLPESGLKIAPGYPKAIAAQTWGQTLDRIAREKEGYFYLTMKSPAVHAMACIVKAGTVFYLEPQSGLYAMPANKLKDWGEQFYAGRLGEKTSAGSQFNMYRVTQA